MINHKEDDSISEASGSNSDENEQKTKLNGNKLLRNINGIHCRKRR
jgi:hypothetical protein